MKLIELNKKQLNIFLTEQNRAQFLQSWEWGKFQEENGFSMFRYGVEEEGKLVAVISLIKKKLFGGWNYFYAPRMSEPKVKSQKSKVLEFLFDEIEKLAKKEKCLFLRYEPNELILKSKILNLKSIDLQPAKTLMLDLSKSEEELLAGMHQKTRYNIRLAEKKGVEIINGQIKDFDEFWKLISQTGNRDGFRLHNKEYYRKMLSSLSQVKYGNNTLEVKLFLAKYQNKILSANIVTFFGDTVTYLHGASSNEDRNIMAPYLIQWEVIKKVRELGYKYYDFYGVDEKKWPGVTKFKNGFCIKNLENCEISYPGTYDLVFSKMWYNVYKILRRIRRLF